MIESWFLADTETLKKITKNIIFKPFDKPEQVNDPFNELKKILGKKYLKLTKPQIAELFIKNGFCFENAAKHTQCHSIKEFIKILENIIKQ